MRYSLNKIFAFLFSFSFGLFLLGLAAACRAYEVEIGLPGMPSRVSDPGAYIKYLFIFGISLAGFLAVGMIVYGGIQYMLSSSVGSTQKAKDIIIGALSGVALILCSYLLLATIDPSLTKLSPTIPKLGNVASPSLTEPASLTPAIGGGASNYQWTQIPQGKYCKDVLGAGWSAVDSTHCSGASPGLSYDCCGKF